MLPVIASCVLHLAFSPEQDATNGRNFAQALLLLGRRAAVTYSFFSDCRRLKSEGKERRPRPSNPATRKGHPQTCRGLISVHRVRFGRWPSRHRVRRPTGFIGAARRCDDAPATGKLAAFKHDDICDCFHSSLIRSNIRSANADRTNYL